MPPEILFWQELLRVSSPVRIAVFFHFSEKRINVVQRMM